MKHLARLLSVCCAVMLPAPVFADGMWSGGPIVLEVEAPLDRVPEAYQDMVTTAAEETGFSVALIDALIRAESGYDPKAVSAKGAQGLVQIMPATADELDLEDPFDAQANLLAGLGYLQAQLDAFGSLPLALAAYNAGPGAVRHYEGIPPYAETQAYVSKILRLSGVVINPPRSVWRGGIGSARASSASRQSVRQGDVS